ncbi:MAG: TonB-dependent receptor, partial [Pseudomonadales bacterium]
NDIAQGSEFNLSHLLTNNIVRVEIIRGPQSALWGSDALAGVVNVITTGEAGAPGLSVQAEAGSFNTLNTGVAINYRTDRSRIALSANHLKTDGTNIARNGTEDDGYKNRTLALNARVNLTDDLDLGIQLRETDTDTDFDGVDFVTTGLPVDAPFRTNSVQRYGKVDLALRLNDTIEQLATVARTETNNINRTDALVDDATRGSKDSLHLQTNLFLGRHTVSLIAEHEHDGYQQRGLATAFGDPNKSLSADTTSIAGEYRFTMDAFNVSASLRHDNNSEFEDANTWRLTGLFQVSDSTALFTSVGKSIKNPTFTERFGFFDTFIGNPLLRPEHSWAWELGIRQQFAGDRVSLSGSYFEAELEDEINGFVFDPATNGFTASNNTGKSQRAGTEIELSWLATPTLSIDGSYTYLDATEPGVSGKVIEIRRPKHLASLQANYAFTRANLNIGINYNGSQFDNYFPPFPPFQERVELPSYILVNATLGYQFSDSMTATLRVENAFDETYEDVFGFRGAGISAYAGLKMTF